MKGRNIILLGFAGFYLYAAAQRKNNQPPIYYVKWLPHNFNALAIPPFGIFIKEEHKYNKELIMHELVHWKQFQREGLFQFILGYNMNNHFFGYDRNPYEIEARFCESNFCKLNYTSCVRNGLAKTIHNPTFRK